MAEPFVAEDEPNHPACGIGPSRRYPLGQFDVSERPTKECPFDPADGHRYTAAGVPVCVHPEKVGLPAARYKSEGAPVPQPPDLQLPADADDLVPYLRELLYGAAPAMVESIIDRASAEIPRAFPEIDAVTALRLALGQRAWAKPGRKRRPPSRMPMVWYFAMTAALRLAVSSFPNQQRWFMVGPQAAR